MEVLAAQPYASRARTAVVTRDRGLQARATRAGGLTRSIDWLMRQVAGTGTGGRRSQPDVGRPVGIGQGKPPRPRAGDARAADEGAGVVVICAQVEAEIADPAAVIEAKLEALADPHRDLGEQKIDLIVKLSGAEMLPVHRVARSTGNRL